MSSKVETKNNPQLLHQDRNPCPWVSDFQKHWHLGPIRIRWETHAPNPPSQSAPLHLSNSSSSCGSENSARRGFTGFLCTQMGLKWGNDSQLGDKPINYDVRHLFTKHLCTNCRNHPSFFGPIYLSPRLKTVPQLSKDSLDLVPGVGMECHGMPTKKCLTCKEMGVINDCRDVTGETPRVSVSCSVPHSRSTPLGWAAKAAEAAWTSEGKRGGKERRADVPSTLGIWSICSRI